jgi:chitin-binding protein
VTWSVTNSWSNGFQLGFTVTNSGTSPTSGWTVSYSWPSGQTASQIWTAAATQSGATVTATNLSYNGAIPPSGSTTFGLIGHGSVPSVLPGLQCTSR